MLSNSFENQTNHSLHVSTSPIIDTDNRASTKQLTHFTSREANNMKFIFIIVG